METRRILLPGMETKRSRQQVLDDILKTIGSGTDKPTRVMYKANLSWNTLQSALEYALEHGLIRISLVKTGKRYSLTDEGKAYVALVESAWEMLHKA